MMSDENVLVLCYNRGCGHMFDPNHNNAEDCAYHPGYPVFHDAYKGWSCCNKKCVDFTEFLNIKGCTKSFHNNEKPSELHKPKINKSKMDEVIKHRAPVNDFTMERPPFTTPQVTVAPTISPALLEQNKNFDMTTSTLRQLSEIQIGQNCNNTSCKVTYQGPESDKEDCYYHSGVAIFHEGLKYWSCCQKKTTDFTAFLQQPGCTQGTHLWTVMNTQSKARCRMDWHQTGSFVIVSFYAKKYEPNKSLVRLNPIRLSAAFYFPIEDSFFNIDLELQGIIDVEKSSVNMLPTKIEIKLKKAYPGSWSKLDVPNTTTNQSESIDVTNDNDKNNIMIDRVDSADLTDL